MSRESDLDRLLSELKRRRVYKVAAFYVVAGFVLLQALDVLLPMVDAPAWLLRTCVIGVLVGFPLTLLLAWVFDITPEGVERTADLPDGLSPVLGKGARVFRVVMGLFTIGVLMTGAGLWLRPGTEEGTVRAGTDVIAVLPFRATGPDVGPLSEGMADLLAANLDQVGAIRTISPRRVLREWEERAEVVEIDEAEGQVIGREAGASSVLQGSVTQAGREARVVAELYSIDGARLARASARAPVDQVLLLVDSLSVDLLRGIWRSREPLPAFNVSRITTASIDAVRAFLRGESSYRRSAWADAILAYEEAVRFDSTFALAHVRLASANGWLDRLGSAEARLHAQTAARFPNRLPERERRLVVAYGLRYADRTAAAIDSMRSFVERFPDDADGWFLLGDLAFHAAEQDPVPASRLYVPFERVLSLDRTLTPALRHPIRLALETGDSARFDRYATLMETQAADSALVDALRGAGEAIWPRSSTPDSAGIVEDVREIVRLRPALVPALLRGAFNSLRGNPTGIVDALVALEPELSPGALPELATALGSALAAAGRISEADRWLGRAEREGGPAAASIRYSAVVSGVADPQFLGQPVQEFAAEGPWPLQSGLVLGSLLLRLADTEGASAAVAELDLDAPDRMAVLGWVSLVEGDTTAGVSALGHAIPAMEEAGIPPFIVDGVRFRLLDARAREPDGLAALDELLSREWASSTFVVLRHLTAGEVAARDGDGRAARAHLARFLRILEGGDPSVEPLRRRATAALARLEV